MNCIDITRRRIIFAMQKWLEEHAWTIAIAVSALVSSYAIYGYRLTAVEAQTVVSQNQIITLNSQQQQIQVSLAQIQVDIQYIKQAIQDQKGLK